jgi:hypothetical protein
MTKYWDLPRTMAKFSPNTTRDWEYLHAIRDFTRLERNVVMSCREWFGINDEELFNAHVDHVLAEVFDQTEHSVLSVEDIDIIVLTIGNMLTSKLLKSGRNWFKMTYP